MQLSECEDLLLHGYFIDIWRAGKRFHDVPDNELSRAVTMPHAGLCHRLWNYVWKFGSQHAFNCIGCFWYEECDLLECMLAQGWFSELERFVTTGRVGLELVRELGKPRSLSISSPSGNGKHRLVIPILEHLLHV